MPQVVTITLNPAVDVSTTAPQIEPARKLRCGPVRRDPGGGGINVARVIRRLGGEVLAIFPAGGPVGALLERLVAAEHLPSVAVPIAGDTREDFTVVETATGREFRFVLPGPKLSAQEWQACLRATLRNKSEVLVASGGLAPGAPDDFHAQLARRAKADGAKLALDCSGPALKAALEAGVWLVKPNLRELEDYAGWPLQSEAHRIATARSIVLSGGAKIVALTLGEEGALLVTEHRAWRASALPIRRVSSVGAGDSFMGGLVWALSEGRNMEEAFRWAMATGSAALLSPGTELAHAADVKRLLPLVRVESV
ncbi:MAG: 1-phosphofructokinase family hexose kinase [Parcubacteria group bacterium]